MIYYAALRQGKKWRIEYVMECPDTMTLATADTWIHAAGYPHMGVITTAQTTQKNVLMRDELPVIRYDADKYWRYKLANSHPNSADRIREYAAKDGVPLPPFA